MEKERQCVIFQSSDGQRFKVDDDLIGMCPTAKHVLGGRRTSFRNALGGSTFAIEGSHVLLKREGRVLATLLSDSPEEVVVSFPEVRGEALGRVIDYCWHSLETAKGDDVEKKQWDAIFQQLDQSALCELASAAYYLDVKPLVNLTSRIIASKISGKTTEELRETLGDISLGEPHPGDGMYSTRTRLQRKLNRSLAPPPDSAPKIVNAEDDRTVDELLNFIDGNPPGSASEAKRQKRKMKKQQKKVEDEGKQQADSPEPSESRPVSPANGNSPTRKSPSPRPSGAQPAPTRIEQQTQQQPSSTGRAFTNHQRTAGGAVANKAVAAAALSSGKRSGAAVGAARDKISLPPNTLAKVKKAVEDGDRPAPMVSSANEVVWAGENDAEDFGLEPEQQEALDREIEEFRRRLESSKQRYLGLAS